MSNDGDCAVQEDAVLQPAKIKASKVPFIIGIAGVVFMLITAAWAYNMWDWYDYRKCFLYPRNYLEIAVLTFMASALAAAGGIAGVAFVKKRPFMGRVLLYISAVFALIA